jgi:hypothetical protein
METGERTERETEQKKGRTYCGGAHLTFDPLKDLNLPSSYDEVLARFKQLQGERAGEALN